MSLYLHCQRLVTCSIGLILFTVTYLLMLLRCPVRDHFVLYLLLYARPKHSCTLLIHKEEFYCDNVKDALNTVEPVIYFATTKSGNYCR